MLKISETIVLVYLYLQSKTVVITQYKLENNTCTMCVVFL